MSSTKNRYKAEEVQMQLGDPLPLPYKISKPATVGSDDVEEEETAVDSKHFNQPIILKKKIHDAVRRVSSGHGVVHESEPVATSAPKPRPFPIRREYLFRHHPEAASLLSSRNAVTHRKHTAGGHSVVDSIQERVAAVRQLSDRLSEHELRQLALIESQLGSLVRQKEESVSRAEIAYSSAPSDKDYISDISIDQDRDRETADEPLKELERLQRMSRHIAESSSQYAATPRLVMCAVAVLVFLLASFAMSGLTYDYCYYFC